MAKKTIAVIGEGITEKFYINSLRDTLKIKPTAIPPKRSSLTELERSIKKCIEKGYSEIYCLIDLDNKINDGTPQRSKNAEKYAKIKDRYHNKKHTNTSKEECYVFMIESYPSTEIFFRYYFGYTSSHFTNDSLKEHLKTKIGYDTSESYFIKHSIHDTLTNNGGKLDSAISASKQSVKQRDPQNKQCTFTEMGILIEKLL